jgi:hypothetical protein
MWYGLSRRRVLRAWVPAYIAAVGERDRLREECVQLRAACNRSQSLLTELVNVVCEWREVELAFAAMLREERDELRIQLAQARTIGADITASVLDRIAAEDERRRVWRERALTAAAAAERDPTTLLH